MASTLAETSPASQMSRKLFASVDLVAPALAVYGVVALVCALLRTPCWLAVVAATLATVFTVRRLMAADSTQEPTRSAVAMVATVWVGVTGFVIFCCVTAGQWFIIERDPGFYSTTGRWFADHNSFPLESGTTAITSAVPGLTAASYAYVQLPSGNILSQGGPLLPILLGHFQRLLGPYGLMWGNAILTGLALVALFAWARRFLPSWWAVVPSLTMAVALPTLYVARSAFSEGATMVLLFGGLALLTRALQRADSRMAWIATATMGATTFSRLDGVAVGGLVAVAATGIWVLGSDREPWKARHVAYRAVIPAVVVPFIAISIYAITTPEYLFRLRWETASEFIGLVLGAFIVTRLANNIMPIRGWISARTSTHADVLYRGVTWLCTIAFLFLTSRPLWEKVRLTLDLKDGYQHEVALVQMMNGQVPDQARTYDELTTVSTAWYFGWFVLGLSVVGLVWFALRSRSEDRDSWAPILGSFGVLLPLYFWAWHITPDQLWASRHLLMLGYPVLILLATFAASRLSGLIPASGGLLPIRVTAVAILVALFLVPTMLTTKPVALVRQYDGMGTMIGKTCDLIAAKTVDPEHTVVLITGGYAGALQTPMRMFCEVPVVRTEAFTGPKAASAVIDLKRWAQANRWHIINVEADPGIGSASSGDSEVAQTVTLYWRTLDSAPSKTFDRSYLVTVDALSP
ncbi:MAG: hypothetical protein WCP81_08135 [Actinomycetes bacterium]